MKGIILAGGNGSRLWPATLAVSKQLLPIYDKPMIYYPICTLFSAGIREIMIITRPEEKFLFERLLKDGSQWGSSFIYKSQEKPRGLAEAFLIAEEEFGDEEVCLILGDNLFSFNNFNDNLKNIRNVKGGHIFGHPVVNPQDYGVVELDSQNRIVSITEKPKNTKSNLAIPGLYFFSKEVFELAQTLSPSIRGELEIVDLINSFLEINKLALTILGSDGTWLDTGTLNSFYDATNFVKAIEQETKRKFGSPELQALEEKWITLEHVRNLGNQLPNSDYGMYLAGYSR